MELLHACGAVTCMELLHARGAVLEIGAEYIGTLETAKVGGDRSKLVLSWCDRCEI